MIKYNISYFSQQIINIFATSANYFCRLTIAYLRLREFAAHGDPPWNRDGRFDGKPTLKGPTSHCLKQLFVRSR